MQKEEYSMVKASAVVVVVAGEGLEGSSDKKCLAVGTRRKPCKRCDGYAQTVFLSGTFLSTTWSFPSFFITRSNRPEHISAHRQTHNGSGR